VRSLRADFLDDLAVKLRRFGKFAASMQRERQLQTLRIVTVGHDDRLTDALPSDKASPRRFKESAA
jgi:hypothetical protein